MPLYRYKAKVTAIKFTGDPENVIDITEMLDGGGFVTTTQVHIIDEFDEADDIMGPIGSVIVRDENGFLDIYRPDEIGSFNEAYEEVVV